MTARARSHARRAPARPRNGGSTARLVRDGGVAEAERQTAIFQRKAVLAAARDRWATPEELTRATGLHVAVVAKTLGALMRGRAIDARADGRYRAKGGSR